MMPTPAPTTTDTIDQSATLDGIGDTSDDERAKPKPKPMPRIAPKMLERRRLDEKLRENVAPLARRAPCECRSRACDPRPPRA